MDAAGSAWLLFLDAFLSRDKCCWAAGFPFLTFTADAQSRVQLQQLFLFSLFQWPCGFILYRCPKYLKTRKIETKCTVLFLLMNNCSCLSLAVCEQLVFLL